MRCEELMKRDVACIGEEDSIEVAARTMREENIGFLPVCDLEGRVLGTLTDRDIVLRVCAEDRTSSRTKAGQVMTRDPIAARPDADVEQARALMAKHQKSRILIVELSGVLVGVISLSDLARHAREQAAETLREVAEREARV